MKHLLTAVLAVTACLLFARPEVVVFATGGTIAGSHSDKGATVGYKAATLPVDTLLKAVPELGKYADVRGVQAFQIASENMTMDNWFKLAADLSRELAKPGVSGAVVTHGTDTLEETAYFLNLTLNSEKPVVLVGAMRPATAYSADGPLNLLNAVRVAASPASRGFGTLIVMNDSIFAARDARKGNTIRPDAFRSGDFGLIGTVFSGTPNFYYKPLKRHTVTSEFAGLKAPKEIPRVDIVYCYGGAPSGILEYCVKNGAKGLVLACTGNGSLSKDFRTVVKTLIAQGIAIVRSTRIADGPVVRNGEVNDDEYGTIPADTLNPQKARILLTLCLIKGMNQPEITRCFTQY